MRKEIRLAGFGGQGIILAGYILGKAAGLYADKEAVFTQSYGPEARGGACAAQVIVSDEPVDYPLFDEAEFLVLMSQEAAEKYGPTAKIGATVLIDTELVDLSSVDLPDVEVLGAPFTRIAEQDFGLRIVANIVMLGFVTAATGLVEREAAEEAIRTEVKERFIDLNLRAFAAGLERGQQIVAEAVA
ncbi:MAG: 2-oxoacid:acceptor oxidoreductase family protein [Dehalococcoidia bacterium]|jgi:2-oxoglutarate ferredoxin oxidoreductase subunit gamma|nr:2-oxoacid:acceptor oxidoreductase family protein [Dehalococcoidia bacterium]